MKYFFLIALSLFSLIAFANGPGDNMNMLKPARDTSFPKEVPDKISCENFNIHNPENTEITINASYDAKNWTKFSIGKNERKILTGDNHKNMFIGIEYNGKKSIYRITLCKLYMLVLRDNTLKLVELDN